MSAHLVLLVAAGGVVGALARYGLDHLVRRMRVVSRFPWATLAANLSGSAVLGALTGLALGGHVSAGGLALAGTGFCGAYTTFSTFTFDTVTLTREGEVVKAVANLGVSLAAGLVLAAVAVAVGSAV